MSWHGFTVVDGLVGLMLLAGFVGGIRRGLSGELARAIATVASVLVAIRYTRPLADEAMSRWDLTSRPAMIGAFLALLLGCFLVFNLLRTLLGRLADFSFKGPVERLGGGLCGLARAGAVAALLLLLLGLAPNDNLRRTVLDEPVAGRLVSRHLRPLYDQLSERIPEIRLPEAPEAAEPLYDIPPLLEGETYEEAVDAVRDLVPGELPD